MDFYMFSSLLTIAIQIIWSPRLHTTKNTQKKPHSEHHNYRKVSYAEHNYKQYEKNAEFRSRN